MRLFRFWTKDQLVAAISDLEAQLATAAEMISYQGGASMQRERRTDALRTLEQLYARYDEIEGIEVPRDRRMSAVRINVIKGY